MPLALAFVVWLAYHVEGIREHGPIGYLKTWSPSGLSTGVASPSGRSKRFRTSCAWSRCRCDCSPTCSPGHMLILIMAGGMIVLLGSVFVLPSLALGIAFYLFEVGLIASLQAFIFAILSAIYMGSAVSHDH